MKNEWLNSILSKVAQKRVDDSETERWYVTSPVFVYVLIFVAALVFFVSLYDIFN